MPTANVLRLEEYRDRRSHRLSVTRALVAVDTGRTDVHERLAEIASLTGADRTGVVWIDEFGPGLVRPHQILDLVSDRPRRDFPLDALNRAWENGVPGTHEAGVDTGPTTFAIALGSDGTRSWFLVADSVHGRGALTPTVRSRVMFLAGECSAIVLHRDLDSERGREAPGESRFAGWPILKDLEGREDDEAEGWRIAQRFVVGRLVRLLLDEGLVAPRERLMEQAARGRAELARDVDLPRVERQAWLDALDSYEHADLEALATTLFELAEMASARGHFHTAVELFGCSFEIAAALSLPRLAADSARLRAVELRRQAEWAEAMVWYAAALEIAAATGLKVVETHALCGLSVIRRERGNLPAARELLDGALAVAQASGDPDALGAVYANYLTLEQNVGNMSEAVGYGWKAVGAYGERRAQLRALASLAGALTKHGDRTASEDAWTIVATSSDELYYRVYAHDALAHLAALRGDAGEFERQVALCDALDWENGPRNAKAEILFYRALSYEHLGDLDRASAWYARARDFAEQNEFGKLIFRAQDALDHLAERSIRAEEPLPAPRDVREGVRALREELVGV